VAHALGSDSTKDLPSATRFLVRCDDSLIKAKLVTKERRVHLLNENIEKHFREKLK
jgi:hypothetical protein